MKGCSYDGDAGIYVYLREVYRKIGPARLKQLVNALVKYSLLLTGGIYLLGTVVVLFRSRAEGLPFVPLSIVQLAILAVYLLVFIVPYAFVEYHLWGLWQLIRESTIRRRYKLITKVVVVMMFLAFVLASALVLGYLVDSFWVMLLLTFLAYCFVPALCRFCAWRNKGKRNDAALEIWLLAMCALVFIYMIPMSLGGLAAQEVEYCSNMTQECFDYKYYGDYDGMLLLKDGDTVLLEPIGNGSIRYKLTDSKMYDLGEHEET